MVCGQLLSAWALGHWDLSFVEPVLTTNLVVALLLAVPLSAEPVAVPELGGAVLLAAGVAVFTVFGTGRAVVPARPDWDAAAAVGGVALVLVAAAWRRAPGPRALVLGIAAGMVFGVQDALTRRTVRLLTGTGGHALQHWAPYALVATALVGILIMQDAFATAPLHVSLPGISAAEPVFGILLGVAVFHEPFPRAAGALAVQAVALAVIVGGVIVIARAPALQHHPGPAR